MVKLRIYMMEKQFAAETSTYRQPNREAISQPYIPPGHEREPRHLLYKPPPPTRKQDKSHIHSHLPGSGPGRRQFLEHPPFRDQYTSTSSQRQNSATYSASTSDNSGSTGDFPSYWEDRDISYNWKPQNGQGPTELGAGHGLWQPKEQESQDDTHLTDRHCVDGDQTSSESYQATLDQSQSESQGQMLGQGHFHDNGKGLSQSERTLANK